MQHSSPIKILVTIPWFTPAFKAGGPIQSVQNMVNQISAPIQFELLTGNTDIDGSLLNGVVSDQQVVFNSNTQVTYLTQGKRYDSIKTIVKKSDAGLIFINGIYSFYYNLLPVLFFKGARMIVSARGMLHPPALKQKWLKKKIYLMFLKPLLRFKKVEFHATDEMEALHIESVMGKSCKIWVAPNIPQLLPFQPTVKKAGSLHLITVALISPMKNHLKVLQALKFIEDKIVYDIVGPIFDAGYWNNCLELIKELPSNISVRYHGAIPPSELMHFYHSAHIFICPSQSENFGHAFFEALSAGKPLITSNNTPWKKLQEKQIGSNVAIDVEDIVSSIRFFVAMEESTYTHWSDQAASFARQYEGVKQAESAYLKMFQS